MKEYHYIVKNPEGVQVVEGWTMGSQNEIMRCATSGLRSQGVNVKGYTVELRQGGRLVKSRKIKGQW